MTRIEARQPHCQTLPEDTDSGPHKPQALQLRAWLHDHPPTSFQYGIVSTCKHIADDLATYTLVSTTVEGHTPNSVI
jgi:hypothetical protein